MRSSKEMTKMKILLIEDDEVLSRMVHEELIEAGFESFQAFDGEVGLAMAREKHPDLIPDLILLDILLPKKNGFEVLEILKKLSETKAIPVVLLTMLGGDDDIKRGMQLGADAYIVKSQFALSEIVERVKTYFAEKALPGSG
jgi:DNA-binding response OmpR family regulator